MVGFCHGGNMPASRGDGDDDGDDHLPVEWKVARWAESGSWGADSLAHSLSLWGNSL